MEIIFQNGLIHLAFLYITKAINIYDISRGFESLHEALNKIKAKLYLISFKQDMLFFPEEMKKIADVMHEMNKANLVEYIEIDSDYGHDAFLVETHKFDQYIKEIL